MAVNRLDDKTTSGFPVQKSNVQGQEESDDEEEGEEEEEEEDTEERKQ